MNSSQHIRYIAAAWVASSLFALVGMSVTAYAQNNQATDETTNMTVVVREYDGGQPISQAHITLQFQEARSIRRPKKITYSAKTNLEGRYKFTGINKGPIVLVITAEGHQSYGKDLQLEKDNQVFEIKLKKPQPLV